MDWVLYFVICWIAAASFITSIKKKEAIISVIIYMILVVVISLTYGIVGTDLDFFTTTKEKAKFIEVVLHRLILVPFLLLNFISKYNELVTYTKKAVSVVLTLMLLLLFEFINVKLQLFHYVKWDFFVVIILNSFFIFITLIINNYLHIIQQRGEQST